MYRTNELEFVNKIPGANQSNAEKLAQYMVEKGMLDRELAENALSFSRHENIDFDEALLILENQKKENNTSTRSHISGKEAKLLRRLIENDLLSSESAAEITRDSLNLKISALNILSRIKELVIEKEHEAEALELLDKAGVTKKANLNCSRNWQIENLFRPLVVQVINGNLSGRLEKAALQCAELVEEGELSRQEAVLILRHMQENNTKFEAAVKELGFAWGSQAEHETNGFKAGLKAQFNGCIKKFGWKPALQL